MKWLDPKKDIPPNERFIANIIDKTKFSYVTVACGMVCLVCSITIPSMPHLSLLTVQSRSHRDDEVETLGLIHGRKPRSFCCCFNSFCGE